MVAWQKASAQHAWRSARIPCYTSQPSFKGFRSREDAMKSLIQILASKRPEVISVEADEMVIHALSLMDMNNVGAVLVVANGKPIGILTERDYARKVVLRGRASSTTHVEEVMTAKVISVGLAQTVEECMAIMTERRIRHLPVTGEDGTVLGILSIGDLVKETISGQSFDVGHLEHYLTH
jgi:CBS domain-containing protein